MFKRPPVSMNSPLPNWRAVVLAGCGLATACASMPTPRNLPESQYQSAQRLPHGFEADTCTVPAPPAALAGRRLVPAEALAAAPDVLGPGDRLQLLVSGDKDVLSGTYLISANGRLVINGAVDLPAAGRTRADLETELRDRLVADGQVRAVANNVRLLQVEAAGVSVSVEGAVFEPGLVSAGERATDAHNATIDHPALGDFNGSRTLASAVRLGGGVRPDAALGTVYLIRGDTYSVIDLTSALGADRGGSLPINPQLAGGDRIIVPTAGCFQPSLMRPSPVTAPGLRVYISNLSRPADSNATAAVGRDSTSLPYGTRFLQALVSANCVGGSAMNAQRSAVLISHNPLNGHSVVIARSIEHMVRNADRDDIDPYLMPNDAIACYDSRAMTVVDAAAVLGNLLGPAVLIKGLKP